MRQRRVLLGLLLLLPVGMAAVGQRTLSASEARCYEVLQPLESSNGIELSRVTYFGYHGEGGFERIVGSVQLTCAPNSVLTPWGRPENLNVASRAGLSLRVLRGKEHEEAGGGRFMDTLRVVLSVGSLDTLRSDVWPDTVIVETTVQCAVVNAAQSKHIRFVTVEVVGSKRDYRKFGGTYSTDAYRCGPSRHWW